VRRRWARALGELCLGPARERHDHELAGDAVLVHAGRDVEQPRRVEREFALDQIVIELSDKLQWTR
jgi:hypothetical protein